MLVFDFAHPGVVTYLAYDIRLPVQPWRNPCSNCLALIIFDRKLYALPVGQHPIHPIAPNVLAAETSGARTEGAFVSHDRILSEMPQSVFRVWISPPIIKTSQSSSLRIHSGIFLAVSYEGSANFTALPLKRASMSDRSSIVDLRSDTVTKPTPAMRRAMAEAEVGDDVYGEDPTVNRLQARAAEMFEREAALFVPSGSMGNLISVLCWTRPGMEVICDERGHINVYELASIS